MNQTAVLKVTSHAYNGQMTKFNMNGAPKELLDRITAMLQHCCPGTMAADDFVKKECFENNPRASLNLQLKATIVLNWILASGWTLTQTSSTSISGVRTATIDTYVFQK